MSVVGPLGVFVRVGVREGVTVAVGPAGVLVRVGVFVGPEGVLVRVGVREGEAVAVGLNGVFVRVGVADGTNVDVGTGVPPGALPQASEPLMYAGTVGQSV